MWVISDIWQCLKHSSVHFFFLLLVIDNIYRCTACAEVWSGSRAALIIHAYTVMIRGICINNTCIYISATLLSQYEHGRLSGALLVSSSFLAHVYFSRHLASRDDAFKKINKSDISVCELFQISMSVRTLICVVQSVRTQLAATFAIVTMDFSGTAIHVSVSWVCAPLQPGYIGLESPLNCIH